MFKSIGLNIEHPETFFVQQGRITQIVSFKPLEIMEMLMESAGVALFHEIADNTRGVMKEKSEKLEVTQQRMKLNFGPRLKMMEKERAKLAEHESLQSQVNEKKAVQTRLIKYQAHKTLRFGWETLSKCEKSLEENQKLKEFFKSQLENLHRQNESESGETKGLTEDLIKLGSTVEGMRTAIHKSRLEREEKAREKKLKSEKVQALREKQAEKDKTIARSNTIKESMEALIGRLNERMDNIAEEKLQLGLRGELGDRSDDPAKPIENRIVKLKKEQAKRKDDIESLKSQINMTYEHLKNNEKNKDKLEQDLGEAISEENKLTSEVENLKQIEQKLADLDNTKLRPLKAKLQDVSTEERRFHEVLRNKNIRTEEFQVNFINPYHDFNRKLVYGRAYQLINVTPEYLAAIEAGCGGKLMGIAVENDTVSKMLLTKKCFEYFVQLLPLNSLVHRPIPDEVIRKADNIARRHNAKVILPWDKQVSSPVDPRFSIVHRYCTNNFLICTSIDAAAEMVKSRQIPVTIVTLDGDSFDPNGEASGGFRGERESIPKKWHTYQQLLEERKKDQNEGVGRQQLLEDQRRLEAERDRLIAQRDDLARKVERLDRVREKITHLRSRMTLDSASKYAVRLPLQEDRLKQEKEELERLKKEIESSEAMLQQVKRGSDIQGLVRDSLAKIKEEETRLAKEKEIAQKRMAETDATIELECKEIEEIKRKIVELEKSIDQLSVLIEERTKYLNAEQQKIELKQREYEDVQTKKKERQEKDEGIKQQVKDIEEKKTAAENQIESLTKQITTLKQEVSTAKDSLRDDPSLIDAPFQRDEQLERLDVKKFERELNGLRERFYQLDKQINKDVESERNRLEEQMQDLANKENILKQDKDQIYTNLDHLDEKSQQSVMQCFEFVNKHLEKIFGILLPGAMARMEMVDTTVGRGEKTKTVKGIKMKIGFNNHWKESMTELSGGQRSLLALSFLLAMLKYRAAPFYILDEIDSAMDLAHTENVGYIISQFFPQSQFIVISLKGGLFNAANIIFRTNLVDGRSQINRYDNRKEKKKVRAATMAESERQNSLDMLKRE